MNIPQFYALRAAFIPGSQTDNNDKINPLDKYPVLTFTSSQSLPTVTLPYTQYILPILPDAQHIEHIVRVVIRDFVSGTTDAALVISRTVFIFKVLIGKEVLQPDAFANLGYFPTTPIQYPDYTNVAVGNVAAIPIVLLQQVILASLSILIGKVLTDVNAQWFSRRLTAISKRCNASATEQAIVAAVFSAGFNNFKLLSVLYSKCFKARQDVFFMLSSIGGMNSIYTPVVTWTFFTLAYANMAYVGMIQEYLIKSKHNVLLMPILQADIDNYKVMLQSLRIFDTLAKYARVLYDETQVPTITRKNFPLLAIAAVEIGRIRKGKTMAQFRVMDPSMEIQYAAFLSEVRGLDQEFLSVNHAKHI